MPLSRVTSCFALFIEPVTSEVLFVQQRSGKWSLPGGHKDPGETNTETLVRECLEEIGFDVTGMEPAATLTVERKQGGALVSVFFSRPEVRIQNEIVRACWGNPDRPRPGTSKTVCKALVALTALRESKRA